MKWTKIEKQLRSLEYPDAPQTLSANLLSLITEKKTNYCRGVQIMKWAITVSILVMFLFVVFNDTNNVVFAQVIKKMEQQKNIHIKYEILGKEGENFEYVNLGGKPMDVEAWVKLRSHQGNPDLAKMTKTDRDLIFDGKDLIIYFKKSKDAKKIPLERKNFRGTAGFRHIILPEDLIEMLSKFKVAKGDSVSFKDVVDGERHISKVSFKQRSECPDNTDPHFLQEFDRKTTVWWDSESKLLLGIEIYILYRGKEILFLKTTQIEFPENMEDNFFAFELPEGGIWDRFKDPAGEAYKDLSPEDVAHRFFTAAEKQDWDTVRLFCESNGIITFFQKCGPIKVNSIGKSFKRPGYPGVFVPYDITLWSGSNKENRKKHNLALKYNQDLHRWVYDGGI